MPKKRPPAKQAAPSPNASRAGLAIGLVCLGALAFAVSRLTSSPPAPPPSPAPSASATATAEAPPPSPLAAAASAPVPSAPPLDRTYVGRQRCGECHEKQLQGWERDWHARALSPATGKSVVGNFKQAHFKGSSSEAWMTEEKGHYQMRTTGADGALGAFPVSWVIGGKRMQDTVTVFPDGRWQVLPVYFHVTGKGEWVDYTETKQGALGPDHPFFWSNFRRNVNRECLDCHVTGLDVRYQRDTHAWTTQMVDAGVACESCHGPGGRHADSLAPEDIVHPAKVSAELGFALCAQCHGLRSPLFPILDAAHRFTPGQRYEEFFQPLELVDGSQRSGDFFPDGRPKTSSIEVQALMQSRCYRQGKATCLTCHTSPHGKHEANELRPPTAAALAAAKPGMTRADVSSCQGCHQEVFAAGRAHSHHQDKGAQSCIACHMPKVVTGVLDTFPDHAIDIPVPENTARHGIPNACSACHPKESPEALTRAITTWWPDAPARAARRLRLADAFDEATREQSRPALEAVLADEGEAPLLRGAAAALFGQRFPREAAATITPLLTAADALVRTKAVEALRAAKAKEAAAALVRLGGDASLFVREAAAVTLAEFGDARAEPALRALTGARESEGLPRPHLLLGFTLSRRNDLGGAIQELERAVDLQPYHVEALVLLADLYTRTQRPALARSRLEEALRFDAQHPGARRRLAALGGGP